MLSCCRFRLGVTLVETAATIVIVIPLTIAAIFVAIEASQVYGINQGLQQAARDAARGLATAYASDFGIVNNASDQAKYGFSPVISSKTLSNYVADESQFQASFNPANPPNTPASVTVTVTYASGKFGLAPFPQVDPLFLGQNYQIKASATYSLE